MPTSRNIVGIRILYLKIPSRMAIVSSVSRLAEKASSHTQGDPNTALKVGSVRLLPLIPSDRIQDNVMNFPLQFHS
jgi:hypothetical protein